MQVYGVDAIVRLTSHFIFIYFTFWSIRGLNLGKFFQKGQVKQIQSALSLLAIAVGFLCSTFFMEVLTLVRNFLLTIV